MNKLCNKDECQYNRVNKTAFCIQHQLKVGDKVYTHWDNAKTEHEVVVVDYNSKISSQTGVMVRVKPALRLLASQDWIDSAWFRKST